MKKLFSSIVLCALCSSVVAQTPAIKQDATIEKNIEQLIGTMSLDAKIGQMFQLSLDQWGEADPATGEWKSDEARINSVIEKYKIGSALNAPGGHALTVEQWQQWIRYVQAKTIEYTSIPCVYGLDSNHGATYMQGAILFPQPINIGASFNIDLMRQAAEITAYETRAADCPWVFNPVVDLGRDPRWPRMWENFGEDPIVNARMAEAEVAGYQGNDPNHLGKYNVAACVKHYMAYGIPWSGKDRTPAYLAPNILREKFFEPFKAAILAGSLSLMVNSGSINGVPVHASWEYLTKWLKEDLQWDGMIVTDWADIINLYQRERVAKDKKDAIRIAINAGVDMSMDPYEPDFCDLLKELVQEGQVSQSRIDDAVRRILRLKYRLGLFDQPNTDANDYPDYGSEKHAQVALQAAQESEILLKNEQNILPLKKGQKILLTGPNANSMRCLNGGWSYTWQGDRADEFASQYNTIYEALCNKYGAENIVLKQGVTYIDKVAYYEEEETPLSEVLAAAAEADIIIACIGENSYCETPGNLSDLCLSTKQRHLVRELSQSGKPIILVLNEGRPRIIADIEPLAQAIIHILLPGNYGADALADLLAGDANFSAKLPYTYPREINSLANYDYKVSEEVGTMDGAYNYDAKVSLQWPFGYGMSYTSFEYSNISVDKKEFSADDIIEVTIDVKNTGDIAGKEAVLLYSSDLVASIVPDNKRLRCFTKIQLQPGETQSVTFHLPAKDLAFVNADNKWTLEEGDFILKIGSQSTPIYCKETKIWDEPNI